LVLAGRRFDSGADRRSFHDWPRSRQNIFIDWQRASQGLVDAGTEARLFLSAGAPASSTHRTSDACLRLRLGLPTYDYEYHHKSIDNATVKKTLHLSVSQKNPPYGFMTFFAKRLGIFGPNFTCILYIPICARLQIFIQLSPTVMKLCHGGHSQSSWCSGYSDSNKVVL